MHWGLNPCRRKRNGPGAFARSTGPNTIDLRRINNALFDTYRYLHSPSNARGDGVKYNDSLSASFARFVRSAVQKSHLTKSERQVTLMIVNLWFYHKSGEGVIYPGREKIAKKLRVSVRTVASTLAILREAGALKVVSHLKGGGRAATRYKLKFVPLLLLCGCDLPDWMQTELRPILHDLPASNCTPKAQKIAPLSRAKIAHGKKKSAEPEKKQTEASRVDVCSRGQS